MASSTLDPDNMPEKDRQISKGHGTSALGPSDTSDSGSDVQDGMRWTNEADIGLSKGTQEDPDSASLDRSAGPDIGDAWVDSDTDSGGTGETAAAGRDPALEDGADIGTDRVDSIGDQEGLLADEEPDEPDLSRPGQAGRTPSRQPPGPEPRR